MFCSNSHNIPADQTMTVIVVVGLMVTLFGHRDSLQQILLENERQSNAAAETTASAGGGFVLH